MKKTLKLAALVLTAAIALSSCGFAGKSKQTTTQPASTTSITTLPRKTTAEKTTTYPKEDNYYPQTTTKAPAQSAATISQQLTNEFKGEKLTAVKEAFLCAGFLESRIHMFTNAGETLDGAFNAPSTYDVTKIVYGDNGHVSIYGVKNRIVPDALKEFAGGVAMEVATQKIVDIIL